MKSALCTPFRDVWRAFLAGKDDKTGVDYSFRKEWIRRRMEELASVFGIDVLTYAIMSNHLHTILRNRPDVVAQWSDEEVAIRWLQVVTGKRLEDQLADRQDECTGRFWEGRVKAQRIVDEAGYAGLCDVRRFEPGASGAGQFTRSGRASIGLRPD